LEGLEVQFLRPTQPYIWTREGWLYLAVVLDLYSRMVVGWSMNRWINQQLVVDALHMGVGRRCLQPGLVVHSDQGRQYTSLAFQRGLRQIEAVCSMSRKGDCWDKDQPAYCTSFFRFDAHGG
jgi:putative transposase